MDLYLHQIATEWFNYQVIVIPRLGVYSPRFQKAESETTCSYREKGAYAHGLSFEALKSGFTRYQVYCTRISNQTEMNTTNMSTTLGCSPTNNR